MSQETKHPNHLINEKSPYLLQHAYNPVNWYPWCEEAFDKAAVEDKPIFLSIGYSTCHWCHVMERESFEDQEVADLLNAHFISIKVDKEERPDIDAIYMSVCTALHGHGGWPLTILMTPAQKPFYAATYLPKHSRGQMLGLMGLLQNVQNVWVKDKERLIESSEDLTKTLESHMESEEKGTATASALGVAFHQYRTSFDAIYGGFGSAPKFPSPHNLLFLLRYSKLYGNEQALNLVKVTLLGMYQGGIYDHIGGGFSRYSTDQKWLAPHFEKMLYDNALLALAYTEAYEYTREPLFKRVTEEILEYVKREMQQEDGGFYCAQDADSEGEEGKYYIFTPEEVKKVLGEQAGEAFCKKYDITEKGNFEGKSIPNLIHFNRDEVLAMEEEFVEEKKKLYEYRLTRTSLHKDDKVLTSWNALMIMAFAKAYRVFGRNLYLEEAKRGLEFIQENLMDRTGRLYVRYRDHHCFGSGHVDDYAFLGLAYFEVYQATFRPAYLEKSKHLMEILLEHFWDMTGHGFYLYADDAEKLILRPKEVYDGAIPSGNSAAAYLLCLLERTTSNELLRTFSDKQVDFLAKEIEAYPSAYGFGLLSYLEKFRSTKELVCLLKKEEDIEKIQEVLRESYHPNLVVIVKTPESAEELEVIMPHMEAYKDDQHEMAFYLCENLACREPFYEIEKLSEYLKA